MFTIDNYEFVLIDTDVVARVKEPRLDLVITVLRTDGATLAANQRYELLQQDDQWFVLLNSPLIKAQTGRFVEENAAEVGEDLARALPVQMAICAALEEFCERYTAQHGEPSA
jgi:hypothetical protein